jgi:dimethylamine corrinoid protein
MNLIEDLYNSIIEGDSEKAVESAEEIVSQGLDVNDAIINGLNKGMKKVSELYAKREYFLPEIIIAADAVYAALNILKPHVKFKEAKKKGIIVIGVVRGDIHDIGKNLTKIFLEASGYKVIDCGRNVKPETFIEEIKNNNPDILALSTLMSPTLQSIEILISELRKEALLESIEIIIGGAATSQQFADSIGVHYCNDASEAVKLVDKIIIGGKK